MRDEVNEAAPLLQSGDADETTAKTDFNDFIRNAFSEKSCFLELPLLFFFKQINLEPIADNYYNIQK